MAYLNATSNFPLWWKDGLIFYINKAHILRVLNMRWCKMITVPDSKVHGVNMGPTWVLSAPDGPHVGPTNLAIRGVIDMSRLEEVSLTSTDSRRPRDDAYMHQLTKPLLAYIMDFRLFRRARSLSEEMQCRCYFGYCEQIAMKFSLANVDCQLQVCGYFVSASIC